MIKKRYAVLLILVTLLGITTIGIAMGLFDFAKICLSSEVSAVVMLNGKPVAGAEITRMVEWKEKVYTTTTSDAQGHFHFEPTFANSVLQQIMPVENVIDQIINIRYQGKEYLAWRGTKRNLELNGEFADRKPHPLTCELTAESRLTKDGVDFASGSVRTICTW
jgi:hypothetical protein